MRVLIVSATERETAPLAAYWQQSPRASCEIEFLITGVGMVATAAWCARRLAERRYDLALNFGVCGSFDPVLVPGTVVHVVTDQIAEMGAEDGDAFLPFAALQLPGAWKFSNSAPPAGIAIQALPVARGITVNTVHGNSQSIAAIIARCEPQVESMEGAAFMCACLMHQVPFAQIRAVSNVVETRDRAAWEIAAAVGNLNLTAQAILEQL
jgi:futalosine hydrolase